MLDENFEPHLGDFGLARLIDHQKDDKTTMMAGTLGYMAPELPYTGKATKETDVYSFGILVLEVVCGRHPLEPSNADIPPEDIMLVNKVRRAHEAGKLLSVVDPRIETVSSNVATIVAATAAHHQNKTRRTTTTTTTTTVAASSDLEAASHQNMKSELDYNSKTTHCKLADLDHAAAADQYCGSSSSSSIKDDEYSSFSEALNRRKEQTIMNENEQKMRVLQLGLLCSLREPTARPSMRAVSQILSSSSCTTSTSKDQAAAAHETTLMPLPPLPPTFSLPYSADLTDLSAILCSIELQTQSYNSQIDAADPVLQIVSDKQPLMSDRLVFSQEYTDSAPAVSPSP
jgi:serine/threonine protein kinase